MMPISRGVLDTPHVRGKTALAGVEVAPNRMDLTDHSTG
jgi:hypothetical protein